MAADLSSADARRRLVAIIKERSFSTGTTMKLASGRTSNYYFNMKPTMLHPEGAHLIGRLVLERLGDRGADFVGGLEMGAVPIATVVAAASHVAGRPVPAFFVRKQAKEHGTQKLIEGLAPEETLAGKRCLIVEDVTTTGGSSMKAIEAVRAAGGTIAAVITVVDREEGAKDTFAAAGVAFLPVLTVEDFK
jgi:orotate phosphoribosyltransferase